MHVFTIGYEGATQPELVAALQAAGVELLADIRAVPLSRRPGFSKSVFAAGLREGGIDYVGLKALGMPPQGREAARRGDYATLARVYAGQLELPEAMVQGAQLRDLAEGRPTALLCFERSERLPPIAVDRRDHAGGDGHPPVRPACPLTQPVTARRRGSPVGARVP